MGVRVAHFSNCDSTQLRLADLLAQGAPDGTVVVADEQEAGKGRQGRVWFSHRGALQFSVALKVLIPWEYAPRLTLLTGAALLECLQSLHCPVSVKWPNDILIPSKEKGPLGNYRKVAGILAELASSREGLEQARIGIGLNLNAPEGGFPKEIDLIAGSLPPEVASMDRVSLLDRILDSMEKWTLAASSNETFARCLDVLRAHSSLWGTMVDVPDEGIRGKAIDFSSDGALVVQRGDGTTVQVIAGDVWPHFD